MIQAKKPTARVALRGVAMVALGAGIAAYAGAQGMPGAGAASTPPATSAGPVQLPPLNGIAHIAIRVKDIAASLAFYHKLGYDQAFAMTAKDGTVSQSFLKLDDRQFIELYPMTARDTEPGFMHLCFEGVDLNALHDAYVAEGLTPISVRTAAAGNLLFTMKGLQQFSVPQNIEYTQYMPGSLHSKDFGQHLSPDRVGDKMTVVALAMQDPAAARAFYIDKLGFTPAAGSATRLNLPGTSGEQVEIVPVAELGARSSIVLTTPDLNKSEAQLKRQEVAYQRASGTATDGKGKTHKVEMIAVTDPDGNIIRREQQQK
jgi:catechol 2,3-dioxygenase-like lactoylglutathione lyase family enzyme